MIILIDNLSLEMAEIYALVLASAGIPHRFFRDGRGWGIFVREEDFEIAADGIEQYHLENPDNVPDQNDFRDWPMTFSGIWASALLAAFHIAISGGNDKDSFVRAYGSSASHILQGEIYRCATSLLIHADIGHLVGNMVGLAIFGTAVCGFLGWGVGWLAILLSGMAGNLVNAFLYGSNHLSIGASTAVFGAVGILSGCQFVDKIGLAGRGIKSIAPLLAGVALLGLLGSSEHSDITAHLFGFITGLFIGIFYAISMKRPLPESWQFFSVLATLAVLALAWANGFD